jgi:hypothetical protein
MDARPPFPTIRADHAIGRLKLAAAYAGHPTDGASVSVAWTAYSDSIGQRWAIVDHYSTPTLIGIFRAAADARAEEQ